MENTNPDGSVLTVKGAAQAFEGFLGSDEPQGQPEEAQAQAEEVQYEAEAPEYEEGEDAEEEVQETPRYRVKAGDEELEVDLDELIKGYSRTADYTRKTQTLAEQRKAIEAESQKVQEAKVLRDQYAQRLQLIEQMLNQQPEEDLSALKDSDPIGYAVKMAERVEREKQLSAVRQEREAVLAKQQAEHQQFLQHHLRQEAERLTAAIPEYADEVKGELVKREIREYAKSIGFSDQELSQVYDHRAVVSLWKAAQYDKLMKSKPGAVKKVAEAPKTLKPGTGTSQAADDQSKKLRQQLKKSGKARDAAALFERFL
jgi:hypothetical protein